MMSSVFLLKYLRICFCSTSLILGLMSGAGTTANDDVDQGNVVVTHEIAADAVLCYTGQNMKTVLQMRNEMNRLGDSLSGFDENMLIVHSSDETWIKKTGDEFNMPKMVNDPVPGNNKGFCFSYKGDTGADLYKKIKKLGWLSSRNDSVYINDGGIYLYHKNTGKMIISHPDGYQEAARLLVRVAPDNIKEIYLTKNDDQARQIDSADIERYADTGEDNLLQIVDLENEAYNYITKVLEVLTDYCRGAENKLNGYYQMLHSPRYPEIVQVSTIMLATAAVAYMTNLLKLRDALALGIALGVVPQIAAPYLLPDEVLKKTNTLNNIVLVTQSLTGKAMSAAGGGLHYTGKLFSYAGQAFSDNAQSVDNSNGWPIVPAAVLAVTLPITYKILNLMTFGYLGSSIQMVSMGLLYGFGIGGGFMGAFYLLMEMDMLPSGYELFRKVKNALY